MIQLWSQSDTVSKSFYCLHLFKVSIYKVTKPAHSSCVVCQNGHKY